MERTVVVRWEGHFSGIMEDNVEYPVVLVVSSSHHGQVIPAL
jgi:hypothetical protein